MIRHFLLAVMGLLLACAVTAEEARRIVVLAPDLPAASEPGGKGRDAEIVATVLRHCGYEPSFRIMPFGRHLYDFDHRDSGDAVMTVPAENTPAGYESSVYIWYQNGASFLESNSAKPYRISQLRGLRVISFKHGAQILDIQDEVGRFDEYSEHANQRLHSNMLFLGRVDAVLSDGLIFAEVNRRLRNNPQFSARVDMSQPVMFTPLFQPSPYKMAFRERAVRDDFERCYRQLEGQGVIRRINVSYVDRYRDTVGHGYLGY